MPWFELDSSRPYRAAGKSLKEVLAIGLSR
jgi:hypothetical protein